MSKEEFIDNVYDKATRPNPKPHKWRTNPSSAPEKTKLVTYCNDLEDVVVYQQNALNEVWKMLNGLKKSYPDLKPQISEFMFSIPRPRYRKDRSHTLGNDTRVYDEHMDGEPTVS